MQAPAGAAEHRAFILARRSDTVARLDQLSAGAAELEGESQALDVPDAEDLGEANGAMVERDRLLALAGAARVTLAAMDAALARIDAGTYGVCAGCGQRIPDARLEAMPEATHCVGCKTGGLRARA